MVPEVRQEVTGWSRANGRPLPLILDKAFWGVHPSPAAPLVSSAHCCFWALVVGGLGLCIEEDADTLDEMLFFPALSAKWG